MDPSERDVGGRPRGGSVAQKWAPPAWLLTPPTSNLGRGSAARGRRSEVEISSEREGVGTALSSSAKIRMAVRRPMPMPMLTLILVRLDSALLAYCRCLSRPGAAEAAAAARALDASSVSPPIALVAPRGSSRRHSEGGADDGTVSSAGSYSETSHSTRSSPVPTRGSGGGMVLSPFTASCSPSPRKRGNSISGFIPEDVGPHVPSPSRDVGVGRRNPHAAPLYPRRSLSASPPDSGRARRLGVKRSPPRGGGRWRRAPVPSTGGPRVDPAFAYEWDRLTAPLMLLAGAEALFAGLEHLVSESTTATEEDDDTDCNDSSSVMGHASLQGRDGKLSGHGVIGAAARKLLSMYAKVRKDLVIVGEILCDPILGAACDSDEGQSALFSSSDCAARPSTLQDRGAGVSAMSLSATLASLVALVNARITLITIHTDLVLRNRCAEPPLEVTGAKSPNSEEANNKDDGEVSSDNFQNSFEALNLLELSDRCNTLLTSLPEVKELRGQERLDSSVPLGCSVAVPMMQSLRHEIKATSALLAAWHHLKQCRIDAYSSAAFGFKKQRSSPSSGSTDMGKEPDSPQRPAVSPARPGWWHGSNLAEEMSSNEEIVTDLLHRQENRNGPPLAVAVVFNAGDNVLPLFEQGFICQEEDDAVVGSGCFYDDHLISSPDRVNGLRSWPAIYLRTTVRSGTTLGEPSSGIIRSRGNRSMVSLSQLLLNPSGKSSSVSEIGSSQGLGQGMLAGHLRPVPPQAGQLIKPTQLPLLPRGTSNRKLAIDGNGDGFAQNFGPNPKVKFSEYWLPPGNRVWPHMEWPNIVSLLFDEYRSRLKKVQVTEDCYGAASSSGGAFTYREAPYRQIPKSGIFSGEDAVTPTYNNVELAPQPGLISIASNSSMIRRSSVTSVSSVMDGEAYESSPTMSHSPHQPQSLLPSAYHIIRINEMMWIVVIVKGEEDRWHRRRQRGLSDEEIRSFLQEMALRLSMDDVFSPLSVVNAKLAARQLRPHNFSLSNFWSGNGWRDIETDQFLSNMKNVFGMKTNSPRVEPLKSPYAQRDLSKSAGNASSCLIDGGHLFFLGAELSQILSGM